MCAAALRFNNGLRRRKAAAALLFASCLSVLCFSPPSAASPPFTRQELKVEKHLKRLNKPPVKTVQSPDGDLIDCVHISHQPAFDHPFLQDHKIQTRPSYHPEGLFDENKMSTGSKEQKSSITQLWHRNGMCPDDTIPIRRTKKEDVLRASSVGNYGKKKHNIVSKPMSGQPGTSNQSAHQHAIAYVQGDKYYGAKATINVWKPIVQQANEFSLSQIWVLSGSFGQDLNSVEAGWQVSPSLYGDNNTRLFSYWTSDSYQATGCYNLLCSGFLQVNNQIAMGATISPVSSYANSQYDINILIWKDSKTGNWWMQYGNDTVMGYWPSSLFSSLGGGASMIQWGGEVVNSQSGGRHTTTQMGSGRFPEEGFGKSSYFKNIQVVDNSNTLKLPNGINTFADDSNCYNVKMAQSDYFNFGGPGRNSECY